MNPFEKALDKIRHQQQLLAILIFFLVAVMIWITVSLISTSHKSGITRQQQQLALPLTPRINEEILTTIESKRTYSPAQLSQFPIYRHFSDQEQQLRLIQVGQEEEFLQAQLEAQQQEEEQAQPSPTPSPSSTPSASPSTQSEATNSGELP